MSYAKKRYFVYLCLTIFIIVIPFITINGNHIFLLSFSHKYFEFLGTKFSVNQLYIMPFLLIFLFVGIFALTSIYGRMWCGWLCPQTIFRVIYRDLIQGKILKLNNRLNKQKHIRFDTTSKRLAWLVGAVIFLVISFVAASNFLLYFIDYHEYFYALAHPASHKVTVGFATIITLVLFLNIIYIKETFCQYICPYARIQNVFIDKNSKITIYDEERGGVIYDNDEYLLHHKKLDKTKECVGCLGCVHICPTHIDIRAGMQYECINCLECIDACAKTMARFHTTPLIEWSSSNAVEQHSKINYLRPKASAYFAVLTAVLIIIAYLITTPNSITLNVNKDAQLYVKRDSGMVDNYYILLINNTTDVPHHFKISVNRKDLYIKYPKKPVLASPHAKHKVILDIYAKAPLGSGENEGSKAAKSERDAKIVPIEISITSTKDDKVHATSKSIFASPR